MAGFSISIFGADKLSSLFSGFKGVLGEVVSSNISNMGLRFEALAKKATPVDTGRLRASITTQDQQGMSYVVGTNVEYAEYVEYGTPSGSMEPRHVEGGQSRVLGQGPFAYALLQFKQGVKNGAKEIGHDIENRFKFQGLRGFKITKPNLPFF